MNQKYDPKEFIAALNKFDPSNQIKCPYCKGEDFTTTQDFATLLLGKELTNIIIGPSIPAGMLICQKCGHIDLFALGPLGLFKKVENQNGKE